MATVKVLDPITRIEGHLKIEVTVDSVSGVQQVVDARASGTLFRGFELILKGRVPQDAPHITQRICGVCPVSHGLASVMALDAIANVQVPDNARILRNLVLGANFVQSHILHFYHLALLDFVSGPAVPPWQPSAQTDMRLSGADAQTLIDHYVLALGKRREAHEMGALFGGRMPCPPPYISGGFTATPRSDRITRFKQYLAGLIPFIQNTLLADVEKVATTYPEYSDIGGGFGNLLAYGVFDLDASGSSKLLRRGRAVPGKAGVLPVDVASITEQVGHSWYSDATAGLNPASGQTVPAHPKDTAYSWLKAPRYEGQPYEVGALARMWVNGDYTNGVSVMDRHRARAQEALKVANAMNTWINGLVPSGRVYTRPNQPLSGSAYGLTEAPRGALGHWVGLSQGKIAQYQIVTPTCWNASPMDAQDVPGPIEKALIGTPVQDLDDPIEVVRVVHSFDPCLSCAVHVMRPKQDARIFTLSPTSPLRS